MDLLGDDISSTPATNGAPVVPATQDLLAEIFGSSGPSPPANTGSPAPPAAPRNIAQDILGLFDSPAAPSPAPTAAPAPAMQSLFTAAATVPQTASPPPAQAVAPSGYTAYDKNELRITLTPQTSPTRPGLVRILANFQATGANPVSGLNFQAAVPKVRIRDFSPRVLAQMLTVLYSHNNCKWRQSPVQTSTPDGQRRRKCVSSLPPVYVRLHAAAIFLQLTMLASQANIRLRLRIAFNVAGRAVQDQVDFAGFPPGLTGGS